jgi:GNAT superfamily N-acetyltransferase
VITVRDAKDGDLEAIGELYIVSFGTTAAAAWRSRRLWQQADNPASETLRPRTWVVHDGANLIGHLGATPWRLQVGSSVVHGYFAVDLMVAPSARGTGLGQRLFAHMVESAPDAHFFMISFYHPASRRIVERLQFQPVEVTTRRMLLLRGGDAAKAAVARRFGNRIWGGAAGHLAEIVGSAASALLRVRSIRREGLPLVEPAPMVDAAFDILWRSASASTAVTTVRDAAYVRWRFLELPGCDQELLTARDPSGALRGYVALATRTVDQIRATYLLDLFCDVADSGAIDALALGANDAARRQNAAIVFGAGFAPRVQSRLSALGWLQRKNPGPAFVLWRGADSLRSLVLDASCWSLTLADGDDSFAVGWRGA